MMSWVVVISVLVLAILSLLRVNVIVSILAAGLTAGVLSGLTFIESIDLLLEGVSSGANTALSYIFLGAFAVAINRTGITSFLVKFLIRHLRGKRTMMVLTISGVASLSQNVIPIHIAFIPILIPPLLKLFDSMRLDRRAVATALTFGLKAPYMMIPVGFGLIFHNIIVESMAEDGIFLTVKETAFSLLIPGLGMLIGLFIAVFITYRKDRDYGEVISFSEQKDAETNEQFNRQHFFTIVAILLALVVQIWTDHLIFGALTGLICMFVFIVIPFKEGDKLMSEGISMMGTIAFVMLVAAGYGYILKETGAVDALVEVSSGFLTNTHQLVIALVLLLIGLIITMGIGSSFGTVPIIAALYVPICMAAGFSPLATASLIGTAGALGDAGSPASDSTLGPTSGLNADGKHHHIWDTCVPTFIHFNIPLILFGLIAAMVL